MENRDHIELKINVSGVFVRQKYELTDPPVALTNVDEIGKRKMGMRQNVEEGVRTEKGCHRRGLELGNRVLT
jgi:hypothetical protein